MFPHKKKQMKLFILEWICTVSLTEYKTTCCNLLDTMATCIQCGERSVSIVTFRDFEHKLCFLFSKSFHPLPQLIGIPIVALEQFVHYSGNFWWAIGKYIHSIPLNNTETEDWLLSTTCCNCYGLFQSPWAGYGHYWNSFPLCKAFDRN